MAKNEQRQTMAPLLAGFSGGTVSTVLLLPLDNIKVRMQVHEGESSARKKNGGLQANCHKSGRLGPARILRSVVHHEGVAALYQGIVPAVIGSSVSWGGFFFVYEGTKQRLRERRVNMGESRELHSWDNFQLACLSGGVMVGITNPVWLIKLRIQLQMQKAAEQLKHDIKPYKGLLDAGRTIVREEGVWALYKGAGPALLLTSHGGVQFVVYEFLKKHFHFSRAHHRDDNGKVSTITERLQKSAGYLSMGAVAKIAASTTTYPLQVLKARLQQRNEFVALTSDGDVRVVRRSYFGLWVAIRKIWEKEGITGFFKGCIPNAFRVAPSAAVTFVVYELVMDMLQ